MLEGIWYGIIAVFVFVGVVASAYIIIMQVLKTGDCGRYVIVIPADIGNDDIGSFLYGAHMKRALFGDYCCGSIVVVDNGMSEAQRSFCLKIMEECGNMKLCMPCEVERMLTGKEE